MSVTYRRSRFTPTPASFAPKFSITYKGNGSVVVGGNKIALPTPLPTVSELLAFDTTAGIGIGGQNAWDILADLTNKVAWLFTVQPAAAGYEIDATDSTSDFNGVTFSNVFPDTSHIDVAAIAGILAGAAGNVNGHTYRLIGR